MKGCECRDGRKLTTKNRYLDDAKPVPMERGEMEETYESSDLPVRRRSLTAVRAVIQGGKEGLQDAIEGAINVTKVRSKTISALVGHLINGVPLLPLTTPSALNPQPLPKSPTQLVKEQIDKAYQKAVHPQVSSLSVSLPAPGAVLRSGVSLVALPFTSPLNPNPQLQRQKFSRLPNSVQLQPIREMASQESFKTSRTHSKFEFNSSLWTRI